MPRQHGDVTVTVTPRQFALIRVACLQRLDRLKDRTDCGTSYAETKAMMEPGGVLDPYKVGRDPINRQDADKAAP